MINLSDVSDEVDKSLDHYHGFGNVHEVVGLLPYALGAVKNALAYVERLPQKTYRYKAVNILLIVHCAFTKKDSPEKAKEYLLTAKEELLFLFHEPGFFESESVSFFELLFGVVCFGLGKAYYALNQINRSDASLVQAQLTFEDLISGSNVINAYGTPEAHITSSCTLFDQSEFREETYLHKQAESPAYQMNNHHLFARMLREIRLFRNHLTKDASNKGSFWDNLKELIKDSSEDDSEDDRISNYDEFTDL